MANTNFINECKNRANANRLGQIIVDGIDTPITNSGNLQSFEIDSGCYVDGNIIGSVYAKCLKANFIAEQNNLSDKSLYAKIGVKYADLSNEYINMGKYKVERPNNEITANMSQITAYSDLYTNLDSKYVCNIDYSTGDKTLSDLYADVCINLGLTPKSLVFINSTIPITDNPFTNGEKNRTVLQTVAKISCSFVDIDVDNNKIDLCWLSDNEEPDYTFYKNDYGSVDGGQVVCGPINCLIIKNSQIDDENVTVKDDASIEANGEHSIVICEDYILYNAELRQQAINSIWDRVNGMKYVDCKLTTYYGKPFLKLGAKIRIYIGDSEYFDTYVLKHNFTYDGSFTSVIESPALTEQEIKNQQSQKIGEILSNTQIEVNKQKKTINQVVKTQTEQTEKITEITLEQDQIVQRVSSTEKDLNNNYTKNSELDQKLEKQKQDINNEMSTTITLSKEQWQASVINYINQNGIEKLVNTLLTIDMDGLKLSKNDEDVTSLLNNKGLYVSDGALREDLYNLLMKVDRAGALFKMLEILGTVKEQDLIQKEKITDEEYGTCQAWYWIGG